MNIHVMAFSCKPTKPNLLCIGIRLFKKNYLKLAIDFDTFVVLMLLLHPIMMMVLMMMVTMVMMRALVSLTRNLDLNARGNAS